MSKYVFGVDLGGTTVKMGLFDTEGNLLDKWEIPTVKENCGERVLPDIAASLRGKMEERNLTKEDVAGVGLGVPGPVDTQGVLFRAGNVGWEDAFNIHDKLREYIDLPIVAANDANVAALGEMWLGGGKGYSDMVMVTLGTGVGGGIIADGRLLTGAFGGAGEIGHIHVEDNETEECGCHDYGCLEQYASATGVVRLARRRLEQDDEPSLLRGSELSAKSVFDAVKAGDKVAEEIADKFGYYLGRGLSDVAAVTSPDVFVIGGGVSKAGEILVDYIKPYYVKYAFPSCKHAEFVMAALGNDAGICGAAKLVLDTGK